MEKIPHESSSLAKLVTRRYGSRTVNDEGVEIMEKLRSLFPIYTYTYIYVCIYKI